MPSPFRFKPRVKNPEVRHAVFGGFHEAVLPRRPRETSLIFRQAADSDSDGRTAGGSAIYVGISGKAIRIDRRQVELIHGLLGSWLETGAFTDAT